MTLDVGDRLPARSLEAPDGSAVPLRRPRRGNTVLMMPHAPECGGCLGRAASLLETAGHELEAWDARLLVAVPASSSPSSASTSSVPPNSSSPGAGTSSSSAGLPSLEAWSERLTALSPAPILALDRDGSLRDRAELDHGEVAFLVADRWGQVYHRSVAAEADGLSGAEEIVKWARYMTIQCPECGVPDEPPGMGRWHRDDDETPAPGRGPRPSST